MKNPNDISCGSSGAVNSEMEKKLLIRSFGRYLLPCIVAILFCEIAPFVDALCVSHKIGESALSAIGIITPVFYIFNLPAALAGIGGGIMISHLCGSGQSDKTGVVFTKTVIFMIVSGLLITLAGVVFMEPLIKFLGGLPENMQHALDYSRVMFFCAPFYIICFAGTYLLTNDNAPNLAMAGMIVCNAVNIVIDCWFIIGLGYGIEAAAWGTVLGEAAGCAVYCLHFRRKERACRFDFSFRKKKVKLFPIVKNGIPETLRYLLFFVQLLITNLVMKESGGVAGLADAALISNLLLVATIFIEGTSEPVIPLTANLYGEGNGSGVLQIKKIAVNFSFYLVLPFTIAVLIYPPWFTSMFNITDPEVLAAMPMSLRLTGASFLFSCFNLIIVNSCASSGKSGIAMWGMGLRILGLQIPLTFLFFRGMPDQAPWIANLLAEIGTFFFFIAMKEGKGLFRYYSENVKYLVGGTLSQEFLKQKRKEVLGLIEPRYRRLAEKAMFEPLAQTLADGVKFDLSLSLLDNAAQGSALVLRMDTPRDMLYPSVKNGFSVEEQFSLWRRMFVMTAPDPEAAKQTVVIVSPECFSGKRLVECAREAGNRVVLAVAVPPEQYEYVMEVLVVNECETDGLCDRVIKKHTVAEVASELRKSEPNVVAVIPGSEYSVESAEQLAKLMNVRGNPPETTADRRNKYAMKQAVAAAGLDHARGGCFSSLEKALVFVDRELEFPLFIKPPESAASQNVFKCRSREDFIEKFNIVISTPDTYRKKVDHVVVEEFIDGDEYAVNIFGDDQKVVVTSIWKYEKISNEFADNLYWNDFLMDINDSMFDALRDYAVALYKAVGIKLGPGHAEIKLSKRGPVVIEIGARLMGSANETYTQIGMRIDAPLETLKVFKTGHSDVPAVPVIHEHLGLANLPYTADGVVTAIHGMDEIRKLPGYFTEELPVKVGDIIHPSIDLDMIVCGIWLRTSSHKQLLQEMAFIHKHFRIETKKE